MGYKKKYKALVKLVKSEVIILELMAHNGENFSGTKEEAAILRNYLDKAEKVGSK